MKTRRLLVAACAAATMAPLCSNPPPAPPQPTDDAGPHAWARQTIPLVLGRQPINWNEVAVVADASQSHGRDAAARALTRDPEYVDHWAEVLVDLLRVDRAPDGGLDRVAATCYGPPLLPGAATPALAAHVLAASTGAPFTQGGVAVAFNMSDVVRSALVLDDLRPVFLAHLFAMTQHPGGGSVPDQIHRVGLDFERHFLGRDNTCLQCHTTDYARTDAWTGWDRHHPIPGSFERALFGSGQPANLDALHAFFRPDVPVTQPAQQAPWGIHASCGVVARGQVPWQVATPALGDDGPFPGGTVRDLVELVRTGAAELAAGQPLRVPDPTMAPACQACAACTAPYPTSPGGNAAQTTLVRDLFAANCLPCHDARNRQGGVDLTDLDPSDGLVWHDHLINAQMNTRGVRLQPGHAPVSLGFMTLYSVTSRSELVNQLRNLNGVPEMRPGNPLLYHATPVPGLGGGFPFGTGYAAVQRVDLWGSALDRCYRCGELRGCQSAVDVRGLAFLIAAHFVDRVWTHATGGSLTIANYFPRHADALAVLQDLTETTFVPSKFSLRALLVRIATHPTWNHHAPAASPRTDSPYYLPVVFEPWRLADPRVDQTPVGAAPERHRNSAGDAVHRHGAGTLFRTLASALGWPAPARFPTGAYPSAALQAALGQYVNAGAPGFTRPSLESWITWEAGVGRCARPAGVTTDWIDRLVASAQTFTPTDGLGPLTYRDLIVALRDRLLADGAITGSPTAGEWRALEALVGNPTIPVSLAAPATLVSSNPALLALKLRLICGAMTESPQFWLTGLAPEPRGTAPRLVVCNPGQPCTYPQLCSRYAAGFQPILSCTIPGDPGTTVQRIAQPTTPPIAPVAPTPAPATPAPDLYQGHGLVGPPRTQVSPRELAPSGGVDEPLYRRGAWPRVPDKPIRTTPPPPIAPPPAP